MHLSRRLGGLAAIGALLCGACHNTNVSLSPQRQAQLEHRATSLLLRAAQGGLGPVRANAIEALVNLAPDANLPVFRAAVTDSQHVDATRHGLAASARLHRLPVRVGYPSRCPLQDVELTLAAAPKVPLASPKPQLTSACQPHPGSSRSAP